MLAVWAFRKTVGWGPEYRLAGQGADGQYIEETADEDTGKSGPELQIGRRHRKYFKTGGDEAHGYLRFLVPRGRLLVLV